MESSRPFRERADHLKKKKITSSEAQEYAFLTVFGILMLLVQEPHFEILIIYYSQKSNSKQQKYSNKSSCE